MRTVLKDRHEVAHYWANQIQPEGRAGNVFYRDSMIWSYGSHFCIARILPSGMVAFTLRDYSPSTGRHKSIIASAASHREFVYCNRPDYGAQHNMNAARDAMRSLLTASNAPRIRQATREKLRARTLHAGQQANAYLAALPEGERENCLPIDVSDLDHLAESFARIEAAELKLREEQHAARLADLQTSLTQWRSHELGTRTGLHELPVALRLSQDREHVQTSHGADIPAHHAPRLWRAIQRVRNTQTEWHASHHSEAAGVYQVKTIRADGSIVVGCHDIAYSEIAAMARELGLAS